MLRKPNTHEDEKAIEVPDDDVAQHVPEDEAGGSATFTKQWNK